MLGMVRRVLLLWATAPLVTLAVALALALVAHAGCSSAASRGAAGGRPRDGLLAVGDVAPSFVAQDQSGAVRRSSQFAGHPIVLYFYPRDATPGCTREACAFRDAWDRIQATGAVVVGVSADDVESHRSFAAEERLPFPLLADPSHRISDAYGVPQILGIDERVTFIIGTNGRIAHVYPDVDPGVHVDEVLAALAALAPAPSTR